MGSTVNDIESILEYWITIPINDIRENLESLIGTEDDANLFITDYITFRKNGGVEKVTGPANAPVGGNKTVRPPPSVPTLVSDTSSSTTARVPKVPKKQRKLDRRKQMQDERRVQQAEQDRLKKSPPPPAPAQQATKPSSPPKPLSIIPLKTGVPKVLCGCFGTIHPVLTNCLICGRLQCEKEGYGFCPFCKYAINPTPEDGKKKDSKEEAHKKRLLTFDKESARRTVVFDDQADYFSNEKSVWLEEEEREKNKGIEEERRKEMHETLRNGGVLDLGKVLG